MPKARGSPPLALPYPFQVKDTPQGLQVQSMAPARIFTRKESSRPVRADDTSRIIASGVRLPTAQWDWHVPDHHTVTL
jgi:hypothetical protein